MTDIRSPGETPGTPLPGEETTGTTTSATADPALGSVDSTADEADVEFDPDPALEAETQSGSSGGAKSAFKEQASKLTSQAAEQARNFAGQGKERATGALDEFARMIEEAAGTVDQRLGEQYGQYARQAAGAVSGFSDNLRNKEVDDLVEDLRGFVRKSPAVAIGTAAALGFVLARVIRSGLEDAGTSGTNDPQV